MRGARHVVQLVLLAALLPGCSGAEPTPRADNRPTVPPSSPATPPAPPEEVRPEEIIPRAQLAAFFRSTRILTGGEAGADSFLEDVRYTSPTDAAADFWDCRVNEKDECTTVIMTTSDNWASAAGIAIPDRVADLVLGPSGTGSMSVAPAGNRHSRPPVASPRSSEPSVPPCHRRGGTRPGDHQA